MSLIQELQWRGLLHDIMPGTEEQLLKESTSVYAGFDPTADSLHIGNLVPVLLLMHLQRAGHKPYVLVGGATGLVGDPSGKREERKFLDVAQIEHNLSCQKKQLEKFLDFSLGNNKAEIVNNYDWFKNISFLDFIRDTGKHITVNYMMSKDSVKNRLETGLSFTEFSYQLVQGYDFYYLFKNKNCKIQVGGSDQWGNILTGIELIRRKDAGEAFAFTAPLLTKSDGTKFGKSEGGNVWLDRSKTSPYAFYQYWLNVSDEDAEKFIKVFTFHSSETIQTLVERHNQAPHLRLLQKELAKEMTILVHSQEDYNASIEAANILFGETTFEKISAIPEASFLSVFEGVPQAKINQSDLVNGLSVIDLLSAKTGFLKSNGEARRALSENSIQINKSKVTEGFLIEKQHLINQKYLIVQRGKKNFFLVEVVE